MASPQKTRVKFNPNPPAGLSQAVDCGESHVPPPWSPLLPRSWSGWVSDAGDLHSADGVRPPRAQKRGPSVCCCGCMGTRHGPMSSAFLWTPLPSSSLPIHVTVPTEEPYFLCSASWWQSELFSSFQYPFSFPLVSTSGACDEVLLKPSLEVLPGPTRTTTRVTFNFTWIYGSVNGKPCLYYL